MPGYSVITMKTKLTTDAAVRARVDERAGGCRIVLVPGGPALVRGAVSVTDDLGEAHDANRPVVAVCTCGLSQRGPWCDSTHKVARTS